MEMAEAFAIIGKIKDLSSTRKLIFYRFAVSLSDRISNQEDIWLFITATKNDIGYTVFHPFCVNRFFFHAKLLYNVFATLSYIMH